MPPRLNKRQQREQEELQALGRSSPKAESSDEEHSSPVRNLVVEPTKVTTGFAALAQSEESEDNEEPEQVAKAKKPKKKRKKKDAESHPKKSETSDVPQTSNVASIPTKKEKKKEKGKAKPKKDLRDDLDKALAELSTKYPDLKHLSTTSNSGSSPTNQASSVQMNSLLAVSLQHLDSEAEMRRFFGSKVVSSTEAQSKAPRGARATTQGLKSNLTKPKPTWWPASMREGLSIRSLSEEEKSEKSARGGVVESGEKWWTVEYSKRYRSFTKAFMSTVSSGDPQLFWSILSKLPWHADTLLQLSEVYRHQEEHADSADYLNRALFTYERSFIGAFTFTSGTNRLDFDHVENRPFYLAIARMIADLQRRGSPRSSFEFARLLLSLDPHTDPQGALLYLDSLSLKAGMQDWLLDMWTLHDSLAKAGDIGKRFNVTALPGWAYARALTLRAKEEASSDQSRDKSTAALRDAIMAFPSVVALVADKADISLSSDIRGHPAFRVHIDSSSLPSQADANIHLLSHLYAHRSSSLWKPADTASWLKSVATSVLPDMPTTPHPHRTRFDTIFADAKLMHSIYRHVMVLDVSISRRLISFFPSTVRQAPYLSCDPCPPLTAVSQYDQEFFGTTDDVLAFTPRTRRQREVDMRDLERVVPNAAVRQQLQFIYDTQRLVQERFPGGVVQFAQAAAQLPEDMFDQLVMAAGDMIGQEENAMPGALPQDVDPIGEEIEGTREDQVRLHHPEIEDAPDESAEDGADEDNEHEDSDEDEENVVPILPVRLLRGLMSRLWGTGGEAPSESESDEEEPRHVFDNNDVD